MQIERMLFYADIDRAEGAGRIVVDESLEIQLIKKRGMHGRT